MSFPLGLAGDVGGDPLLRGWQDALLAWVKASTKLPDARVFFMDQKVERPTSLYVTLRLDGPVRLGACDPVREIYDPNQPAGQEIELRVDGMRTLSVSVQVWAGKPVDGLADDSAVTVASRLSTGIRLPSVAAAFHAAGMGVASVGNVRNLSAVLSTEFEGRASFDVEFTVSETASEYTTYIDRADLTERRTGTIVEFDT